MSTSVAPVAPASQAPITAPVVETQAVAPVVEAAPEKPQSMQDIMDRITRKVSPEALAEPTEVVAVPDDQAAALAAKAGESPAEAVAKTLETPVSPQNLVNEIKADDPEGEVMLRARDPQTGQFSDMDQSRTYELSIRDKTTGEKKVYEKTLPELMRLAKDGIATNKTRDELTYHRSRAPQIVAENQGLTAKVQQLETLTHQLLTADEPWVVAQRENYAQHFTPEARVKQLEQQLQQARTQPAPQAPAQNQPPQVPQVSPEHARQMEQFRSVVPAITAEVEQMVGKELSLGKLAQVITPMLVNGLIPPERLGEVQQFIQGPYREWAKAEAAKQSAAQKELDAARQERTRAQAAARSVGTATRPAGGSASLAPAPTPKPRTVQDAINKAINRPIASAPG